MVTRTPVMPSLDGAGQLSGQTVPHFLYQVPVASDVDKAAVRVLLTRRGCCDLMEALGL